MQEVFLGLVREDSDRAFCIVTALASEGIPVFWQKEPEWAGSRGAAVAHSFAEYRVAIISGPRTLLLG